jgi:hypothetical protein
MSVGRGDEVDLEKGSVVVLLEADGSVALHVHALTEALQRVAIELVDAGDVLHGVPDRAGQDLGREAGLGGVGHGDLAGSLARRV